MHEITCCFTKRQNRIKNDTMSNFSFEGEEEIDMTKDLYDFGDRTEILSGAGLVGRDNVIAA